MKRRTVIKGAAATAALLAASGPVITALRQDRTVPWVPESRLMKSRQPWFYPLTPRQALVSELVAAGLSNKEIAKAIFINETTLDNHVHQVFTKLAFHRRSEIGDWVALSRPAPDPLSTREFQLAALVAAGLTNGEIAKRFANSERTIQGRVQMLLEKLDVPRRTHIVEWVRNRPLAQPLAV